MALAYVVRRYSASPSEGWELVFLRPLRFYKKNRKFLEVGVKHRRVSDVCPPFLQIGLRGSISLEYFFTLCGVSVTGDSYWSRKRRHCAATHFANPDANRKPATGYLFEYEVNEVREKN